MRLNHLDFYVPDIAATADFFRRYFALELREMNERIGRAILYDDQGTEVVLSRPLPKFGGADQVELQRQTYHIGFILAERSDVDVLHARLAADSAAVSGPPAAVRGGWLFYCTAPGNILVEVGWRPPV
ncbi:catechol 2,3-dioxygenase-like lactoylglutathione lyase family enzyme [Rhizobium sp. BK512]|uniref:VOC family protein n=1 Tax=Rhizobium sp. BK512 TaxID=2587010 RepID=UPI00160E2CF7|nr:VOC family protein [Rhizobium sp. BK512]MBB3562284.1 catechol 2,3-dioxygenase-like lactoylglutathione lyase family enzyme [Rhizobium sp. BK512]